MNYSNDELCKHPGFEDGGLGTPLYTVRGRVEYRDNSRDNFDGLTATHSFSESSLRSSVRNALKDPEISSCQDVNAVLRFYDGFKGNKKLRGELSNMVKDFNRNLKEKESVSV